MQELQRLKQPRQAADSIPDLVSWPIL